jgi:nitroreductase
MTEATLSHRQSPHPIDADILSRWSPRAFDASPLDERTMLTLFEAARWAPSAYNAQPWRFAYALRGDAHWDDFTASLLPANAAWAPAASALVFILSDRFLTLPGKDEPSPSATASFDTGAAWALLALQATKLGLHTHAMAGIDHARAAAAIGADERFRIEAAVAIGRIGDPANLSEMLQAREVPSQRRPVTEIAFHGRVG